MRKPIPQQYIDSLPDGYTLLGWGGDFDTILVKVFEGLALDSSRAESEWRDGDWLGYSPSSCYAAPHDSELVELNRKAGKLPHLFKSEDVLSEKEGSICDKNKAVFLTEGPLEKSPKELMQKIIYIAGPMRGKQYFNFPAFDKARDKLKSEGWAVVSPADIDREHGFDAMEQPPDTDWSDLSNVDVTREECFDRDMNAIRHDCSAIYMLKGWQKSTGAQAEYWAARWLGLDIYYEEESICEEAFRIQGGDRQQDYGDPTSNFADIANMWDAYVYAAHGVDGFFTARDVAHMMILMKVARNCHKPKRDNWTDIAGYSQCGGKIDKV